MVYTVLRLLWKAKTPYRIHRSPHWTPSLAKLIQSTALLPHLLKKKNSTNLFVGLHRGPILLVFFA